MSMVLTRDEKINLEKGVTEILGIALSFSAVTNRLQILQAKEKDALKAKKVQYIISASEEYARKIKELGDSYLATLGIR